MGLLLLFQGLYQQELIVPATYATTSTTKAPVYERSLNPHSGSALAVLDGTTVTIAQFTTSRRTLIKGYTATGDGDGLFFIAVPSGDYFYSRINAALPFVRYRMPDEDEPFVVDVNVLIQLQVKNISGSSADYWGTLETV